MDHLIFPLLIFFLGVLCGIAASFARSPESYRWHGDAGATVTDIKAA